MTTWHPSFQIVFPVFGMVALTVAVWVKLYMDRITELNKKKRKPAEFRLEFVTAADHFKNLFLVPVLFYTICAFIAIFKIPSSLLLTMAWIYFFLRICHAFIHVTYNKIIHRFYVYFVSCLVLYSMWILFFWEVIKM